MGLIIRVSATAILLIFELYLSSTLDMKQALILFKKNTSLIPEEVLIGFMSSACKADNDSQENQNTQISQQIGELAARLKIVEELLDSNEKNESESGTSLLSSFGISQFNFNRLI